MRARSHLLKPIFAACLLAVGSSAFAQDEDPRVEEALPGELVEAPPMPSPEEALSRAELMARASGKVVVYEDAMGLPYGEEYFDPNGREVTWRYLDGGCQTASWTAQGSLFCFAYDEPSCWRVRAGDDPQGEWTAHLVTGASDGYTEQWVRMVRFEDRRLQCEPDFVAMLRP
ncbi:hypothetical protein [Neomegalonema sp.]|uniref:hypothetical protein n=1 Tax=Neomegalonema sp. TaxID=2039713 RepID=UPI002603B539|nr:hypothetical protein [Neomegalonema sp.]MDD2868146.1 hypothetical protein [Neomegalonema sp.]